MCITVPVHEHVQPFIIAIKVKVQRFSQQTFAKLKWLTSDVNRRKLNFHNVIKIKNSQFGSEPPIHYNM